MTIIVFAELWQPNPTMPIKSTDPSSEKSVLTVLRQIIGRPTAVGLFVMWLVVLSLDALALLLLPQLRFDDGLATAFSSQSLRYADYERFRKRFTQSDNDVVVLFRSPDFANPLDLARVADFVIEARFIEGVGDVTSVFSLRAPPDEEGPGPTLVPSKLPARSELESLIDNLNSSIPEGARIISTDRTLTAVVVALEPESLGVEVAASTPASIAALAKSFVEGRNMTVSIAGAAVIRAETVSGLFRDVMVINGIGMLIGTIVCLFALRSVALAMLAGLTAGTALLWALGALSWLGLEINVVTLAVPLLVIVLALSDGLHLLFEARLQRSQGKPLEEAAIQTVARVGPACAIASATTALAFCGLLLSESILIRELGMAGASATVVSLLAALTVQPLLFVTFGRLTPIAAEEAMQSARSFAATGWSALPALGLRHPSAVVACSLAALAVSMALYSAIEPAYSLKENLPSSSPALIALEEINRSLAPVDTVDIPVPLDPGTNPTGGTWLQRVEAVHEAATGVAQGALVVSPVTLAPAKGGEDEGTRASRLASFLDQLPENARERFVSADRAEALVRIHMRDLGSAGNREFTGQLEKALTGMDARRPTGFLVMSSFVSGEMISDLNRSFLVAVAMSVLIVALWFRSLRYGLVALLPNILPIAVIGAWLFLSGRGLQFASGIALTVAFGIAVDDTVHVLNRLRLNTVPEVPFDPDAIERSMHEVAPVLVITTAVLSFGLIGTFFSSTAMTGYFGGLAIAVFLLAIVSDLLVLPASLRLLHRSPIKARMESSA